MLIDAGDYFARLAEVMRSARHRIWIVGWDFDASIRLEPDGPPIREFLRGLVDERPELDVRILIWNLATVNTPGASLPLLFGEGWQNHPRIDIRLDHRHPLYASQHQKLICVDGAIAFCGGMDLTVKRWDTPAHDPHDRRRRGPDDEIYEPVHDTHFIVEGPIARTIADVIRHQWRVATDEELPPFAGEDAAWPATLAPDFTDTPIALSRTLPPRADGDGIQEIAALNVDALRTARQCVYVEAQYFAERRVGRVLRDLLRRPDGPEIILLINHISHGWLEAWVMGGNRARILRRLRRADRFGRLRAVHPVVADGEDHRILVHSKVIIVDDSFLKVGSSNLNRRSMGLDTECDLSVEAGSDGATRAAIARIRNRLLGEHLGVPAAAFGEAVATHGSVVRALDALDGGRRRLRPYSDAEPEGATGKVFGTGVLDPRAPFSWRDLLGAIGARLRSEWAGILPPKRRRASLKANSSAPMLRGSRK